MLQWIEKNGVGAKKINYKLRDWVFSRQRYWGEPIPLVHCDQCGYVPLPESQLPLKLPEVDNYMPTDNGESPIANIRDWVETTCPKCKGKAERETDTMPQWAGSSWYFLRYIDPHNKDLFASKQELDYWLPVDWYNGDMGHTTLHLLYSRFWHKFLYDLGLVSHAEPYRKRTSHGMILGENNEKMSKSRGNVVNPDAIIQQFGADTLRTYEMFISAFEVNAAWSNQGLKGCRRFLDRVWKLQDIVVEEPSYSKEFEAKIHKVIKKVSLDYESLKFNTAIATMMSLLNDFYDVRKITKGEFKTFLILLNPVAPHITEEIWERLGFEQKIFENKWPLYDEAKLLEDTIEIAIQINGKVKATVTTTANEEFESVKQKIMSHPEVKIALEGKTTLKEIYIPLKIYNIVVK
jgi:leucyl-tRNA synthetase